MATVSRERIRLPFEVKSIDSNGMSFEGLLSAYSVDLGNDRVHPGAFKRTLDHWRESKGRRIIPLIDQHQYTSIFHVVGKMADGEEQADGLYTRWDMIPDDDIAARAYRRVKGGFVTEMSMGYEAINPDYSEVKTDDGRKKKVRNLREVKLGEGSLVIWGMQPDARINPNSVKQLMQEEAETLAATLESIRARLADFSDEAPAQFSPPASPDTGTHGTPSRDDVIRSFKLYQAKIGGRR